ncbi:MAG TPA: right-handed parallel beta-helix repeat-containing protein [Nitrososphaeraceae archaeon]|nr:right-handed parallel beta-helix repeat-containing protein [Nitrososphaeraceae archaeon]
MILKIYSFEEVVLVLLAVFVLITSAHLELIPNATAQNNTSECVQYESKQKLIHINCKSIHLSDISEHLNNASILHSESDNGTRQNSNGKVWILDAGIVIEKQGGLVMDSTDTKWLKLIPTPTIQPAKQLLPIVGENGTDTYDEEQVEDTTATELVNTRENGDTTKTIIPDDKEQQPILVSKNNGNNPNGIHVRGSLTIDSVKITSWDPVQNDVIGFAYGKRAGEEHTKSDYDTAEPRAFIRVSKDATGTTNITNSELAYLGYSCSRCAGLSYYGGEGSVIQGNDIHHLLKGYYSKSMGNMVIADNTFHDNYLYGIDPHTGSHDMSILRNTVYNNNASGIICSKHCYDLLIEGNIVYNNTGVGRGIAFSINTTNSIARDNIVSHQDRCISFNRNSNFNEIYNNTVSNCGDGFYIANTTSNVIHDNLVKNVTHAFVMKDVRNTVNKNLVDGAKNGIVYTHQPLAGGLQATTIDFTSKEMDYYENVLNSMAKNNTFSNTGNVTLVKVLPFVNLTQIQNSDQDNKTLLALKLLQD